VALSSENPCALVESRLPWLALKLKSYQKNIKYERHSPNLLEKEDVALSSEMPACILRSEF
jgi:hypothetical protein